MEDIEEKEGGLWSRLKRKGQKGRRPKESRSRVTPSLSLLVKKGEMLRSGRWAPRAQREEGNAAANLLTLKEEENLEEAGF